MSRAQTLKEWLIVALLGALVLFVILCITALLLFGRRIRTTLNLVDATLTDTRRVVLVVGGTAGEVRSAAKVWAKASQAQADYSVEIERKTAATLDEVNQTITALNALVNTTNWNLNGKLLPATTHSLDQATEALAAVTRTADTANRQLSNPSITDTMSHLDTTTQHLSEATDATNRMLQAIDRKVEEVLQPGKPGKLARMWRILRFLVWGGAGAGQISNLSR